MESKGSEWNRWDLHFHTRRSPTLSATLGLMNACWRFLGTFDEIHKHLQWRFET
jgi:hypothetical protein